MVQQQKGTAAHHKLSYEQTLVSTLVCVILYSVASRIARYNSVSLTSANTNKDGHKTK